MDPLDVNLTEVVTTSMVRVGPPLVIILAVGSVADWLLHGDGTDFFVALLVVAALTTLAWVVSER